MFGELLLLFLLFLNSNSLSPDELVTQNCSKLLDIPTQLNQDETLHRISGVSQCPPWFTFDYQRRYCKPGDSLGGIVHHDSATLQTSLLGCYCMTEEKGAVTVGACLYACNAVMWLSIRHSLPSRHYPLPCNVSQLSYVMCADLNRRGRLCGECMKGYTVPVYSYDSHCVKCEDYKYNWLKYLAAAFLPLTVFYVVVTLFSISFTSPLLSGVVLVSQIATTPLQLQQVVLFSEVGAYEYFYLLKIPLSLAAFLSLDFYYTFCLHPNASPMAIMSLNYAIAVYPVFLIGITYVLVKLYDHNFRPIVWIWKPLGSILKPLRRDWNVRTSLVNVFASFIYLSSSRIFWTSAILLIPNITYTYQQRCVQLIKKHYLYTFPSVEYFGNEHLPFAVIAISMLFTFCILPMILLFVYPFHWFQQLLNKFRFNFLTLHIFMDVFQGSYKDGTNGTRDYRYFSGLFLFLQLILTICFSQTLSIFYYSISCIWILIYLILHAAFQPFKHRSHNFITIAMIVSLMWGYLWDAMGQNDLWSTFLFIASLCIPLLYTLGLVSATITMMICRY